MSDYGHWDVQTSGEFNVADHLGFVYIITHRETGKFYIGCKHLWKFKKGSRKKNKPSTWKKYTGSSASLTEAMEEHGKDAFTFEILHLCKNKRDLYYTEEKLQMELECLEREDCYNQNIGGRRFFRPVESYRKMSGTKHGSYRGPFRITFKGGRVEEVYDKTVKQWCVENGYARKSLSKVLVGVRKTHKDITSAEYIDD